MAVLGSSPLGLVLDSTDNTKKKIGQQNVNLTTEPTRKMLTSLFGLEKNGISTANFSFTEEKEGIYDISTEKVVEYCSKYNNMNLTYADFAYLKSLGVYPNNRLIIARRFAAPVKDDLVNNPNNEATPLATLISWVPDNEDFFNVSFGENWVPATTSLKDLLNEASENRDLLAGDNAGAALGTYLMGSVNAIPLPGWSEGLQYLVFQKLGLTDLKPSDLPFGNPNLIRKAKMRAIAGKDDEFTGFTTKISVKMVIEYEQKFIAGINPTNVYYDIISNALTFGTSESKFMFRSDAVKVDDFGRFLNQLGSGNPETFKQALQLFVTALQNALTAVKDELVKALGKLAQSVSTGDGLAFITTTVVGIISTVVAGVVSKYKVKVLGILQSLTGSPSAPWHVTIGNPQRPIFSSGDMLVEDVNVTFGKLLAYNDLPSSVKIELTLTNARELGAQEIFRKLSCGEERTYKRVRLDILAANTSLPGADKPSDNAFVLGKPLRTGGTQSTSSTTPPAGSGTGGNNQGLENKDQSKSTSADNPNNPTNQSPTTNATPPNSTAGTQTAAAATTGQTNVPPGQVRLVPPAAFWTVGNIKIDNLQCANDYNFIVGEISKVVRVQDNYGFDGRNKVPLLKKHQSILPPNGDNEQGAVNEIKLLLTGPLKPRYEAIRKCSSLSSKLETTINAIYAGILNQKTIQIDVLETGRIRNNNIPIARVDLKCDF